MEIKLAFGLRNDKIIHISEITTEQKGLNCNCICPVCHKRLNAKLGKGKRRPHFAHEPQNDCDQLHAQQTVLHLLAKEIIQENRSILLPGFEITRDEIVRDVQDQRIAAEVRVDLPSFNEKLCHYESVELEKQIDNIIADAVIETNGRPCVVEFAVTHFVDEEKKQRINKLVFPTFEVDLSCLLSSHLDLNREKIENAVLYESGNRKWIYNPKKENILEEKRAEFRDGYRRIIQRKEEKEQQKEKNILALQQAMLPENYKSVIQKLRNDKQAHNWLKRFDFSSGLEEYPFYMDIPITGEFVFSCDRRVWQGKVFDNYVYSGFGVFRLTKVQERIFGDKFITFDKSKINRTTVTLSGRNEEVSLSFDVVRRYFEYLDLLGFISWDGYEGISKRPSSLMPPNALIADILLEAIGSVNQFDPDVDQLIKQEILYKLPGNARKQILLWEKQRKKTFYTE